MANREVEKWITVNGHHVPVYKGESTQDAFTRATVKQAEDKKAKDIARNRQEADKAAGKLTDEYVDKLVKYISGDKQLDKLVNYISGNEKFPPEQLLKASGLEAHIDAFAKNTGIDREAVKKAVLKKAEKLWEEKKDKKITELAMMFEEESGLSPSAAEDAAIDMVENGLSYEAAYGRHLDDRYT